MWNMTAFVRTDVVIDTVVCGVLIRPSALWACGDQHGCGVVGVLTDLDALSIVPAGGGAAREPGGATVPDPEQLVNVRIGFGSDNSIIRLLNGRKSLKKLIPTAPKTASRGTRLGVSI